MIEIEKNVPLPKGPVRMYPFYKMEIGDSFLAPNANPASVSSAVSAYARKYGGKFRTSKQREGVRVWRIA